MICEHLGLQFYTLCVEQQLTEKKIFPKRSFYCCERHLSSGIDICLSGYLFFNTPHISLKVGEGVTSVTL